MITQRRSHSHMRDLEIANMPIYREPEPSHWGWWIAGLVVGSLLWMVL